VKTLDVARTGIGATSAGSLALFAGGRDGSTLLDTVDIYDNDTGLWTTENLSVARPLTDRAVASVGSLAFFAGGQFTGSVPFFWSNVVDIYDAQTGNWTTETMSLARGELSLTAVGNTMLFAGGGTGTTYSPTDIVERYDVTTGQWGPISHLSQARFTMAATTVAGKALFAGGAVEQISSLDDLDVFELDPWTDLGGSTAGIAGKPWLNGTGSLIGGTSASVALKFAPSSALTLAWISLAPSAFPAIGGTVHAFPFVSQLSLFVNSEGSFNGTTTWPIGIPPGTEVTFQFLVQDASSIHGITLSNGLLATAP
jgi:hypothetical protein